MLRSPGLIHALLALMSATPVFAALGSAGESRKP